MRAVVGVTDNAWAAFLRDRPHLSEANFWLPSGMRFGAVEAGEPFLFKTHWPQNQLVGGGFLSGWTRLRVSEAWEFFGEGNGVATQGELLAAIRGYRREKRVDDADPDPEIGCVLLRDLLFLPPGAELAGPPDFGKPIVTWKRYDLEAANGSYVEAALREMIASSPPTGINEGPIGDLGPTRGEPRLIIPRVGQQAFKGLILTSYHRRCAISGSRITPTLQAAHIRPVACEGQHRVDNGLLLRSDVHTLFDEGYLGIDDRYRLHVSPRLKRDFGNGREFYDRAGSMIDRPDRPADRPAKETVTWHMDTVFRHA